LEENKRGKEERRRGKRKKRSLKGCGGKRGEEGKLK